MGPFTAATRITSACPARWNFASRARRVTLSHRDGLDLPPAENSTLEARRAKRNRYRLRRGDVSCAGRRSMGNLYRKAFARSLHAARRAGRTPRRREVAPSLASSDVIIGFFSL